MDNGRELEKLKTKIDSLAEELLAAYEEVNLFYDISNSMGSPLDSEKTMDFILSKALEIIQADKAAIMVLNESENRLQMRKGFVSGNWISAAPSFEISGEGTILNKAIRAKKGLIINDITKCQDGLSPLIATKSLLSVSMNIKNKVIGVLTLGDRRDSEFTSKDLKLSTVLSSQAALIIENDRLFQENATLAEIGRIVGSTLNIDEVYERFTEEVKKLIPFDSMSINLFNDAGSSPPSLNSTRKVGSELLAGDVFPLAGPATEETMKIHTGIISHSESRGEVADQFSDLIPAFDAGYRSVMRVPLIAKNNVIGAMYFGSTRPKIYKERDLRIAESIGSQIAGAIANAQLYAQQMQMEEALRGSEERFRELYDHAPLGYHEYDAEGLITSVNRTDLEMLGYTVEEMIGQPIWKFNVEEEIDRKQTLAKLAGTLPPDRNVERTYRRKDGITFPVLSEDRLVLDEKGEIKGIRCTIEDITERKRVEEEKAFLQEELRQSQKMEAIGRLAGGIAHDFNNLLTVIRGYNYLSISELDERDPLMGNLKEVNAAADRASDLTRQLLAFSRRQVLELQVMDLNKLIQRMEKMLRRIIGEDIELLIHPGKELGLIKTDPGQMEQVIFNLAVNSRDAMPSGGKLILETENVYLDGEYARNHVGVKPGHYVGLSVSDNGCGMTPAIKSRIFEPFFTTKEKDKGTGLGLSTVYGIVKQSEGNIWAYTEPAKGTTFKIYLPRVDGPVKEKEETCSELIPRGSETVLVVEDEGQVRKLAVQILKKQGYKVLEACHGGDAFLVCERHKEPIHLILTDVIMPGMGGPELIQRLGQVRKDFKVIYMSGYTDEAVVYHGVQKGEMEFLQKPFTLERLSKKVREVLDNR
jgi:PAS domain S-box-containing protein